MQYADGLLFFFFFFLLLFLFAGWFLFSNRRLVLQLAPVWLLFFLLTNGL